MAIEYSTECKLQLTNIQQMLYHLQQLYFSLQHATSCVYPL